MPNVAAPKYINQLITNIKKLIDSNTIIEGDFNTPLTTMDRSSNKKINKEIMALNDTLDQMDLTDIFSVLYQKNMQPRIHYPARLSFKIEGEIKVSQTNKN